ncbi:hypothetical protein SDSE159_14640 [Streptococcus dysgalactiae subsp. equisimilis]|uniref:Membrane protein n=2 Tax=Streptococcus dysgalactiae TaxID=1334 RepID=A0A380JVH8_STRDY|nr:MULTISPECIES: hypothetical protein [Streptococcus]MEE3743658.1 hypothetical protein [Streptococcus dysgalactiae]SUN46815.1 membrane protein [Streptococcus dysgalactiae subsp. dysgalactiae]SUN50323.1 membrane protein [Streptococcus dysgalactiae subsp. dysgalactiae]SUN51531.1 membrane protein [Streptococcus dysgalactiae]SUN55817.1 membrane protein [Streptococcus dysgalactiae]
MNGEISFMDWVGIGSIVTLICVLIKSYWDNEGIKERFNSLSKEQNNLKDAIEKLINDKHQILINGNGNLLTNLKSEREITTKETVSIKHDTKFIYDEILEERTSRRNLYQNVSNASEVLKTIDIMRETIVQNANLEVQNQQLFLKVNSLEEKIVDLSNQPKNEEISKLRSSIRSFESQLARFEDGGYNEAEEIKGALRRILNDLEG